MAIQPDAARAHQRC